MPLSQVGDGLAADGAAAAREIRKVEKFEIEGPDGWKQNSAGKLCKDDIVSDDDSDDEDIDGPEHNKRVVRLALLANCLLCIANSVLIAFGPNIFLQLDAVLDGCTVDAFPDDEQRRRCLVGDAGELAGNLAAVNAAFEFLSAGALGMLSDSLGRKGFCISCATGMFCDMGALTFAAGGTRGGTAVMFAARALAGAMGNQEIFIRATLADTSTPEEAAVNFGLMLLNVGVGLVVGVVGGKVMERLTGSPRGPTAFGMACCFGAALILIAMPEPLARRHRKKVKWSLANPFGAMLFLFSTKYFALFAIMSLVDKTAFSLCFSNLGIFCIAAFGEGTPFQILLMFCGVGIGVVCKMMLPPILRSIGVLQTIKYGYVLTACGFVCVALITPLGQFALMFPALSVFVLGAISGPTQASVATFCVDESQQGTLQGAVGSVEVIGRVLGPFTGAVVWRFAAPAGNFHFLWWGGAVLMIPGVLIAFILPGFLPQHVLQIVSGNVEEFVAHHRKSTASMAHQLSGFSLV